LVEEILKMNKKVQIRTTSIIGLSKNAGKTTFLNFLIQKKQQNKVRLATASIGVDGEKADLLSGKEKPSIWIPEGTIVATTAAGLKEGTASFRILEIVEDSSMLGPTFLAQALSGGTVKLMGTPTVDSVRKIIKMLEVYSVDEFLIDGAFDRMAGAAPLLADQVYLVIGASLHQDKRILWQLVEEKLKPFFYPQVSNDEIRLAIENGKIEASNWIFVKGILTEKTLNKIMKQQKGLTIILDHGLKSFLSREMLMKWNRMGGDIQVLYPIEIAGIAINPYSPEGYRFSANEMKEKTQAILHKYNHGDIEIINVFDYKNLGE